MPAACLLQAVHGWCVNLCPSFLSIPQMHFFATSMHPTTSFLSLKFISAYHRQIFYFLCLPMLFPIITPSHSFRTFTPSSPLSFSASLYPPPSLPSRGVMPSVAREPKPRCLRWLLPENRSCREKDGGRKGHKWEDGTKVKEKKMESGRGKAQGERREKKRSESSTWKGK